MDEKEHPTRTAWELFENFLVENIPARAQLVGKIINHTLYGVATVRAIRVGDTKEVCFVMDHIPLQEDPVFYIKDFFYGQISGLDPFETEGFSEYYKQKTRPVDKDEAQVEMEHLFTNYHETIIRIILLSIVQAPFPLGLTKFTGFIRGSKEDFFRKYKLDALKGYGLLSDYSVMAVRDLLLLLLDSDVIDIENVGQNQALPVLKLSDKATRLLRGVFYPEAVAAVGVLEAERDREHDLIEEAALKGLNKLRWELASQEGIPPYAVCSGVVLLQLIRYPSASGSIKGAREDFFKKYERAFLDKLEEYIPQNDEDEHDLEETCECPQCGRPINGDDYVVVERYADRLCDECYAKEWEDNRGDLYLPEWLYDETDGHWYPVQ